MYQGSVLRRSRTPTCLSSKLRMTLQRRSLGPPRRRRLPGLGETQLAACRVTDLIENTFTVSGIKRRS